MKKSLSVMLMLTICFSLLPASALAAERGETQETAPISQIHEGEKKTDEKQETVFSSDYELEADDGVTGTEAQKVVETVVNENDGLTNFDSSQVKEATTRYTDAEQAKKNLTEVVNALKKATTDTTAKNNLSKIETSIIKALEASTTDETLSKIEDDNNFNCYVKVSVISATVAEYIENSETKKMVKSMAFEVTPMASVKVTTSKGTATIQTVIPNDAISKPIKFRLPVDSGVSEGAMVTVYHQEDVSSKKTLVGSYEVQVQESDHFIELSASQFSIFSYELAGQTADDISKQITMTDSLALGDSVNLNVRIKTIASGTSLSDYTLKYSFAGGEETKTNLQDYTLSTPVTIAKCTPTQYTQLASVEILYQGTSVLQRNLSVEKYCTDVLDGKITADTELKAVCANLLEYGYYAQSGDTAIKPSDTYRSKDASGTTIPPFPSQAATGDLDAVTSITPSLNLNDRTELCYTINLNNTADTDSFKVSVSLDGSSYSTVTSSSPVTLDIVKTNTAGSKIAAPCTFTLSGTDGSYQVTVSDIPFAFLHQTFYLKVEQDGKSKTIYSSPLSCAYEKQEDSTNGDLMKSFYLCHQSAKTYFGIAD